MNEPLDRTAVQRATLCAKYPAEFELGYRAAYTDQYVEPCDAAGYTIGFRTWDQMGRNAWWAGWNLGNVERR